MLNFNEKNVYIIFVFTLITVIHVFARIPQAFLRSNFARMHKQICDLCITPIFFLRHEYSYVLFFFFTDKILTDSIDHSNSIFAIESFNNR